MNNIIYGLIDPNTNELRYIGKTKEPARRLRKHHQSSGLRANNYHNNWIRSLLAKGQRAEMIVIETHERYEDLNQAEIDAIAYFRSIGARLTNGTPGGDGGGRPLGYKHTAASKLKLSNSHTGKKLSADHVNKIRAMNTGRTHTDEAKMKIANAHKGKIVSPESRLTMSAAQLGRVHSEETRHKISAAGKGRIVSETTRARQSAARRGKKRSPHTEDSKRKNAAAHMGEKNHFFGKTHSDDAKHKISESKKGSSWRLIDGKRVYSRKEAA